MNNINLNRNHTLVIFFISLIFYLSNLNLDFEIIPLFCFFLIATIGISHGALDNQKGKDILKFFNIKKIQFFYITYIFSSAIIILSWIILPMFTLLLFLVVASYHFGKEDSVFKNRPIKKFSNLFLLSKGLLVVLAPFYFHFNETKYIFEILNVDVIYINNNLLLGLIALSLLSNFIISKNFFLSLLDSCTIILLNLTFVPLIAFTIYFCFLHSIRHSFTLINEIDKNNFKNGLINFSKKALPLTLLTGIIFLLSLFILNTYYLLNAAILKVVFIGLASLTFPHILLEYLLEKNEKKS
ncbi:Brp/Blh family beta-carotene 15,15'-dioxygenase [Candidatus Pelagibacter bacterium]|nr:Brp/Blh family beta-carotene 15,15'-dioxygenase [Candidatus Pelagibacter bacterium]